eukprot:scaffold2159_cov200-Alexandrium_tamarense.AAC.1
MLLVVVGIVGTSVYLVTSKQSSSKKADKVDTKVSNAKFWTNNNPAPDSGNNLDVSATTEGSNLFWTASNSNTPTTSPASPTSNPSSSPTSPPSVSPTPDTTTTFYIMADAPYTEAERNGIMQKVVDGVPPDSEFLIHLGDLQYVEDDKCEEWVYKIASDILKRSKVPVFVLPGDNDMNGKRCYDTFDVSTNIVAPYVANHLKLKSTMSARKDDYKLVILFGHAEPSKHHDDLFKGSNGLAKYVKDMGKPFIHFHGDWHEWYEDEYSFGVENYMRISLDSLVTEAGVTTPPIRVMVDSSRPNPVRVSRRLDDGRYPVQCCSKGWPRLSDDDDYTDDNIDCGRGINGWS